MNKVKISTSLASVVLIGSMFAGLATFLTVVALMIIFCEIDNIKGVVIRVTSFYVGLILVQTAWGLIYDGYNDVFYGGISNILVLFLWIYLLSYIFVLGMILNASSYKEELK